MKKTARGIRKWLSVTMALVFSESVIYILSFSRGRLASP
jgi:hypothetical protein